ncbi:hypothetical protein ACFTY7_05550 [Streptomyces sp. NPDC057062]|uniref:hypothetical protein n=1 Tax=unclassified Streptomyces TaxID=2593676 RepID=UPI00207685CB|nr:hypothetical protein [Streptomyces sp. MBT84]
MQIKAGKQGGWAELILRTRSAADGDDFDRAGESAGGKRRLVGDLAAHDAQ